MDSGVRGVYAGVYAGTGSRATGRRSTAAAGSRRTAPPPVWAGGLAAGAGAGSGEAKVMVGCRSSPFKAERMA